jgi:hypothetical protein
LSFATDLIGRRACFSHVISNQYHEPRLQETVSESITRTSRPGNSIAAVFRRAHGPADFGRVGAIDDHAFAFFQRFLEDREIHGGSGAAGLRQGRLKLSIFAKR